MTGNREGEAGAVAGAAGYGNGAFVKFGQFLNDRESKAVTGNVMLPWTTIGDMRVKDFCSQCIGNPFAGIDQADVHIIVIGMKAQCDTPATIHMFQGIREKIPQETLDEISVKSKDTRSG